MVHCILYKSSKYTIVIVPIFNFIMKICNDFCTLNRKRPQFSFQKSGHPSVWVNLKPLLHMLCAVTCMHNFWEWGRKIQNILSCLIFWECQKVSDIQEPTGQCIYFCCCCCFRALIQNNVYGHVTQSQFSISRILPVRCWFAKSKNFNKNMNYLYCKWADLLKVREHGFFCRAGRYQLHKNWNGATDDSGERQSNEYQSHKNICLP